MNNEEEFEFRMFPQLVKKSPVWGFLVIPLFFVSILLSKVAFVIFNIVTSGPQLFCASIVSLLITTVSIALAYENAK